MSFPLCPYRRLIYQHLLAQTRLYFQELREREFAEHGQRIGDALRDYDLIDKLAEILDGYTVLAVYNDLEKCAQSRVLYAKRKRDFAPDPDNVFFTDPPELYETALGRKRISHDEAYVRYFDLFIRPKVLRQQGQTLDGVQAFYARHPLLKHVLETLADHYRENIRLAMQRLLRDWNQVNAVFGEHRIDQLERIIPTGSDSHKGGKQVLIFQFLANGQTRKVVYKPSDVEIDYWLIGDTDALPEDLRPRPGRSLTEITNDMVDPFNRAFAGEVMEGVEEEAALQRLRLPTYRILPRNPGSLAEMDGGRLPLEDAYGYLEFVTHEPTLQVPFDRGEAGKLTEIVDRWEANPGTTAGFDWITDDPLDAQILYRQWGQLMAMAHVFSLTDLHMQNQIVSRKKPTLIDLEVAFNAPNNSLGASGIIGNYQARKDPDQHNVLEIGELRDEFMPVKLTRHHPDNDHSLNQLYFYNTNDGQVDWEDEPHYRRDLYEGIESVLAAYRDPQNNAQLRQWLKTLDPVVVRLVPRPTKDFVTALTDLVEAHSGEAYAPGNADQPWQLFAAGGDKLFRSLRTWWEEKATAYEFLQFPDPFFVLEQPSHNWLDLVAMDVPAYYRRIGDRHLRDARGNSVHIANAIRVQYQWLSQQGTALNPAHDFRDMLNAMLNATPSPQVDILRQDAVDAFPAQVNQLPDDTFVLGHYFTRSGIQQVNAVLLELGNHPNFEGYFTALMRRSFPHHQGEQDDILGWLFG